MPASPKCAAGGATTFADSTLDLLDGDGYVVTVAPETVGYVGNGTFWTPDKMDEAVNTSLSGASDDDVVEWWVSMKIGPSQAPPYGR